MKHKILIFGGIALVGVIALGMLFRKDNSTMVTVSKVGRETLISKVSANGRVQAARKAELTSDVMGQVTRLAVSEGDVVKEGQFLLEVDPSKTKANVDALSASRQASMADLESTKARAEQARADFQRAENNFQNGIISQVEFANARIALTTAENTVTKNKKRIEQATSNLEEARVSHSKTTIRAPIDGIVTSRRIELGESAVVGMQNSPGTVLLTISDMSRVEAEMEVDEAAIPNVRLGQDAQVRIDAYPNQSFKGVVTEVGGSPLLASAGAQAAVKFKVRVQIIDPPDTIKPGLSAQADIFTGTSENALSIPFQSLVVRDIVLKEGEKFNQGEKKDEEGVYLVEGGAVKFVPIQTGLTGDMSVEVLSGLNEGDVVASGPLRTLRSLHDGAKVKVGGGKL
jgi:HlyD family secretion protein